MCHVAANSPGSVAAGSSGDGGAQVPAVPRRCVVTHAPKAPGGASGSESAASGAAANSGASIAAATAPASATPAAIDATIYEGVLYLFEQEDDMRVDSTAPFMRIRQWRREFVTQLVDSALCPV